MAPSELLENISTALAGKLGNDLGTLLGGEFRFTPQGYDTLDNEEGLADSQEHAVLITMGTSGEANTGGYVLVRLSDAVLLGGTLLLLSEEQIQKKMLAERLDDEDTEAFAEIANGIASSCTQVFFDLTESKPQFTSSAVSDFALPAPESASPLSPGTYYRFRLGMTFNENALGELLFLFPADLLGLVAEDSGESEETGESESVDNRATDRTLFAALQQIQDQISDFLGQELTFSDHANRFVSKEEFFTPPPDYSVVAKMVVAGAAEGMAYVLVDLKSAITLGATLIMRPADQIAKMLVKATLDGEEADAFGEIANIIAGVYAQVFPETHPRKLHFKRDAVSSFDGQKIDFSAEEPLPPGPYYLSSCAIHLGEKDLGRFDVLFPPDILGISPPRPKAPENEAEAVNATTTDSTDAVTLIVADDMDQARVFSENLAAQGWHCQQVSFKDNLREAIRQRPVAGVFLIMAEVEDRSFATAIKVRSELQDDQPMIIAGPQWTRNNVLKALKYGACDILITPAGADDIAAKARRHLRGKQI